MSGPGRPRGDQWGRRSPALTIAAGEYDARPGPLRDLVVKTARLWQDTLIAEIRGAIETGGRPASADAAQVAFELEGIALATNQAIQLRQGRAAAVLARRAVGRVLRS